MGDERIKGKVREAVQTGAQTKVQTGAQSLSFVNAPFLSCAASVTGKAAVSALDSNRKRGISRDCRCGAKRQYPG